MKQLLKVATILKSKDGEPGYPEAITVLDYSKSGDKYEDISGEYNLVPGEIMEGKPVFIRRGSKASLQFSGPIILIFLCINYYYISFKVSNGRSAVETITKPTQTFMDGSSQIAPQFGLKSKIFL